MTEFILTDRLKECVWTPVERQADISTRGGAAQVTEFGPAYWAIELRYENLGSTQHQALTAWLSRRRGGAVPFYAFRPGRRAPILAPEQSGIALSSVDTTNSIINLTGVTGGISPGDMVSYKTASSKFYVGEVTVGDSDGAVALTVHPHARSAPHASPDVRLVDPYGEFRMLPQSLRMTEPYDGRKSVTFQARQVEP